MQSRNAATPRRLKPLDLFNPNRPLFLQPNEYKEYQEDQLPLLRPPSSDISTSRPKPRTAKPPPPPSRLIMPFFSSLSAPSSPRPTWSLKRNLKTRCLADGEVIWSPDLHAAFLEGTYASFHDIVSWLTALPALALYPPMGKRRVKMRSRDIDSPEQPSLGRCQLIQEYLHQKTGRTRSRRQISSHLQQLALVYKDDIDSELYSSQFFRLSTEYINFCF